MKRIKIIALFFSISVVFSGYFLSVQAGDNPTLLVKLDNQGAEATAVSQSVPSATVADIYSYQQKGEYVNLINSLFAIINSLKEQIIKLQNSISSKTDSLKNSVPADSKNFTTLKNESIISTFSGYFEKLVKDLANINFTKEEIIAMKKGEESEGKRILRLEELMQKAAEGNNLEDLKNSFLAWHNLDEQIISKMKKLPVSGKALSLNNDLIDWLKFHSAIAKKFGEENLTISQAKDLFEQFSAKADAQNSLMKKSTAQAGNFKKVSLINSAFALTCTPTGNTYYFGGAVTLLQYCNAGTVLTIKTPCGGTFFLSYAVMAINPYFKGFVKVKDNTLGRSTVQSSSCTLGFKPYETTYTYEASIIYYGASGGL